MKRSEDFEDHPWFIVPVTPGEEPRIRRWNIALIAALAFVVLGVFAMTITPELEHAAAGKDIPGMLEGVQTRGLTPNIAHELGLSGATHGVVITSVDPFDDAATAGLDRGDVIQEVNRKPVRSVNDYHQALAEAHGQSVLLLINRGGSTRYVVAQAE
jgi:S1-C subfamily serine protease